jgi:hypothetical protein
LAVNSERLLFPVPSSGEVVRLLMSLDDLADSGVGTGTATESYFQLGGDE